MYTLKYLSSVMAHTKRKQILGMMKLSFLNIIYLASIFFITTVVGNNWRCDYTYDKQAEGYFKFHLIPTDWFEARLRCKLEGAVLVSPYPQKLYDSLVNFMSSISNISFSVFTGVHSTFFPGDYHTLNGIPLSKIPIKWLDSQPDNKDNNERCLTLTSEGFAADVNCHVPHRYICFMEKKEVNMILSPCGTTDLEYEKSNITGNCYKFHTVPETWYRASMVCSAEGGHLAIINSNEEAKVIKQLFAKYPERKILGPYTKSIAYVGFYDYYEHGDWRTVHDETLKEAGYSTFHHLEPNCVPPGQYCGCVFRSAELCDVYCDHRIPFICEKKPGSLLCDQD